MKIYKKNISSFKLCLDKWNPYCSKWGYCISYDSYGADGPGQSAGAVEDGQRGQCRTDSDCTPHAPNCSPEGYCSQGLFQTINSNVVKNEVYYASIEDENREGHVESRKEDPLFQERPDLLADVEAVENTVYQPCTYCKYDPESPSTGFETSKESIVPLSNTITLEGNEPQISVEKQAHPFNQEPSSYNPTVNQDLLPSIPDVFGIGSGSLQNQNEVFINTFADEGNNPEYAVQQNTPLVQNVAQTLPIKSYNAVPAVPAEAAPEIPIPPATAALPTPVLDPKPPLQIQDQSLPIQPPNIVTQEHIEPQYSSGQQFNAFNPFQSPQYQTGQATSLHQQRPQYQAANPYTYPSYPSYHYPVWGVNPYFQNRFYFG